MLNSQLIEQCTAGNVEAIRSLIAYKADVNSVVDGISPLLLAVEANNHSLFETLLQADVDLSRTFHRGETVLMIAAQRGYLKLIRRTLRHHPGAPVNARDELGRTALFIALKHGKPKSAAALLDAGADATITDNACTTTLMVCSNTVMARRLLERGVYINARDISGNDAFLIACGRDNERIASFLLSFGARGYTRDSYSVPVRRATWIWPH